VEKRHYKLKGQFFLGQVDGEDFEIDPLQCQVFKVEKRIIAFITDYQEVRKILKHIVEETIRPPPLLSDEATEVTYEPATYFASTMVEFQARI